MANLVSLQTVEEFLLRHGYRERKDAKREYPGKPDTWFLLYERDRSPMIGFPTSKGKVLAHHFERICLVVELHGNYEDN